MRTFVLLLAALPGCVIQHTTYRESDRLIFDEPVDVVEVDVGAGDLTIRVGSEQVEVDRNWSYSGSRPDAEAWVQDGVLHLDVDCRSMQWRCSVDHVITLPAGATILGDIGSGDVDIQGVAGDIDLAGGSGNVTLATVTGTIVASTGSGDIDVTDAVGSLDLDTGSGDVVARQVDAASVIASAGSGDVELYLLEKPGRVDVDTGSGDVLVEVPSGAYRIRTQTGSGDVRMQGVTSDPGADASIEVDTGSGDVDIIGR